MRWLLLFLGGLWWAQGQLLRINLGFLNPTPTPKQDRQSDLVNAIPTLTRMRVPKLREIKDYAWYAGAAYCPLEKIENWDCSFCNRTRFKAKFIAYLKSEKHGTWGYITTNDEEKKIIISFRGTDNEINRMANLKIYTKPFKYAPLPGVMVHQGFLESMESLSKQFIYSLGKMLKYKKYRNYKLVLVGHSLGGAMASLAAVKIKRELDIKWARMKVFTYGQPRTGNILFAQWYNAQSITMARVVNYADSIPHLLGGSLGYFAHHQNEIYLIPEFVTGSRTKARKCSRDVLEDPLCSNGLHNSDYSVRYHSDYFKANFKVPC